MKVQVCTGKSCSGKYSKYIITRLENDAKFYEREDFEVIETCCMDKCKKGPNMKIKNQTYEHMNPARASEIVNKEYT